MEAELLLNGDAIGNSGAQPVLFAPQSYNLTTTTLKQLFLRYHPRRKCCYKVKDPMSGVVRVSAEGMPGQQFVPLSDFEATGLFVEVWATSQTGPSRQALVDALAEFTKREGIILDQNHRVVLTGELMEVPHLTKKQGFVLFKFPVFQRRSNTTEATFASIT